MISPPLRLLAHSCSREGGRAPIYFLAPHRLQGGRGSRSGEGGFADGTLPQEAIKMAPHTSKGRHLHLLFATYHFPFSAAPFHHYRGPPPPVKRREASIEAEVKW